MRISPRWLVPGIAAALVIGTGVTASAIAATAEPSLPPRDAAQLLVDLRTAAVDGMSGTVVQSADLGLPPLPGGGRPGGSGGPGLSSLLSGSNTLRVWYAGPEQARVAVLGTLDQLDVIRDGRDVWVWDSAENRATHRRLPAGFATEDQFRWHPGMATMTPRDAAAAALAALDPSTAVSTDGTAEVAGRDAYELVLVPRDEASLISQVRLAIDAEHHIPMRVRVYGESSDPAFDVRFTQISFDRPDPEQFRFNPPPGATVTEADWLPSPGGMFGRHLARPDISVVGEGWTSVLVIELPERLAERAEQPLAKGFLDGLPTVSGAWGSGRALSGALFSVLLTDDGRVLVGAVTPEYLGEVAGGR